MTSSGFLATKTSIATVVPARISVPRKISHKNQIGSSSLTRECDKSEAMPIATRMNETRRINHCIVARETVRQIACPSDRLASHDNQVQTTQYSLKSKA